jgi:alpha,alpha-trehalase
MQIQTYNYGIIGNGRISALVSNKGSIDWCCFPRFDEQSVFAKILDDEKGGSFAIEPAEPEKYKITQSYIKNTNILCTVFSSAADEFEVIDYIPCYPKVEFLYKPIQIHRIIRVKHGFPAVKVTFDPRFNYGQNKVITRHFSSYIRVVDTETGEESFLYTNVPKDYIINQRVFSIQPDSYFLFSYEKQPDSLSHFDIEKDFGLTKKYWQDWVRACNIPDQYQKEVIRSALTLKLMIYQETGAIVAAPTTSLPEIAGRDRNWDYRYCWLRDAYFTINALTKLSCIPEAEKFIDYIKSTLVGNLEYIRPIYTIDGGIVPEEVSIDLKGHLDSRPVRVGNSATTHYQDDVYGEVILSLFPLFFDERFVREDLDDLWNLVKNIVEIAIKRFNEKDQGIWEFRGESKHYTFSKIMIWAAVDRGYQIAQKLRKKEEAYSWNKYRRSMKEEILNNAWSNELESFTQSYEKKFLDASNLLIPILGLVDGKDPRTRKMINATKDKLKKGGFVFRYINEDDFGYPETAFLICSFWLVDALIVSGQKDEARKYFEELLKYSNHLGLFSEDIHPETNRLLGNFPQAYSHVAIINSAILLAT